MASSEAKKLLSMFKQYDQDGDGVIDGYELAEVMTELDAKWSGDRISELFAALDSDEDGKIEMDEFVDWVFGYNAEAVKVMSEKPLMVLRLNGFGLRTAAQLTEALEPIAPIEQLHHVKGNSKESLVVYASEESARKAFEAVGGVYDEEQAKGGILKIRIKPGSPLSMPGEAALDLDEVVSLTPKTFSEMGNPQCVPNFASTIHPEMKAFVDKNKVNFGDKYDAWEEKARLLGNDGHTVKLVAKLMRSMSLNLLIQPEQRESVAMWRRTMRLLARGKLEFQDPSKMSDMLQELDSFVQAEALRPVSPAKVRATKKARDMGLDDPWTMVSHSRPNTALAVLAS
mmetsp:Transcript_15537/g.28861  ORF Transcript_15537/g.28861 Transcript_15537/m.28861 type:complete len:342 (+) Transcript_15537:51-1076(+)